MECKLAQSKEAMEMEKDKKKGSYPQGMGVNSYRMWKWLHRVLLN